MNSFPTSAFDLNSAKIVSAIDDLPLWSAAFGQKFLDVIRMRPNISVLDVGCGMGFPLLDLSQRLGSSCQCFGIDPWFEAILRANEKRQSWGLSNCFMFPAVAERLPFSNARFDVIFSNNGINNVDDDELAMRDIARVAKPGAQLVITVNLPSTFIEFYEIFAEVLKDNNMEPEFDRLAEHIYRKRKPPDYTEALLSNAGFKILNCYLDKFRFRFLDGSSMLDHFFIKLAFLPSWLEIVAEKNKRETVFQQLENRLNQISVAQNGLTMSVPWICYVAIKS